MKKTKRIKKVFTSSYEVFHLWAAQTQPSARQAGNVTRDGHYIHSRAFFEGTDCYSYGRHYKVAKLVKINGKRVALINSLNGYGPTTGKHIGEARSATSHLFQIDVGHDFNWKAGLLQMQSKLVAELFDKLKQRSFYSEYKVWEPKERYGLVADIRAFNKLVRALGKPKLALNVNKSTLALIQAHVDRMIARKAELAAERQAPEYLAKKQARLVAEQNRLAAKASAEIQAWLQGGAYTSAVREHRPQLIRVKGDEVQTSSQASVPLFIARRALMKLDNGDLKKGARIGHYEFERVDKKDGLIQIGCHTISLEQARSVLLNGAAPERKQA